MATTGVKPTLEGMLKSLRLGDVVDATSVYINGAWTTSDAPGSIDVMSPATEEVIARVASGSPRDVDRAVAAAKAALPVWASTPAVERGAYLTKIQGVMLEHLGDFAELASRDVGSPAKASKRMQLGLPIFNFGFYGDLAGTYNFDGEMIGNSLVTKEAVGVVACITPWNFPAHQIALKVAAAWAAGCTVVVKPSEVAPLLAYAMAEVFDQVGLPPGVFNMVSGEGSVVGEALVSHDDVDMISFTGSTRAGRRISELASGALKRVSLELGGKSANVILEGADLDAAVVSGLKNSIGLNTGQACTALTRFVVPRSVLRDVEAIAADQASRFTMGAWDEEGVVIGPLVSKVQYDKVRGYIQKGLDEGARLIAGGLDSDRTTGYFVAPTIFSDVSNDMAIAREEIFGPVVCIIPYDSEEEAIALANDTIYGLGGAVWAGDQNHALAVAKKIRTGQVFVNGGDFNPAAPFGGFKQSGHGREAGIAGLEEFLETKAMHL